MTALRKLLVVDDDPVVGASFKRVLSGKGYLVVAAENGQQALDRLKAEKFDAVFTDLRMPGMDGLQVAERVRAAQPWTPVVIVTGYGSPASEARALACGVSEFLHKPLSPEMIEDSAEKAVRTVMEGVTAPRTEPAPLASPIAAPAAAAPAAAAPQKVGVLRTLRNMALFLAAPFIGLLYAVLLPFVGLGMLAWLAIKGKDAGQAQAPDEVAVAQEPAPAPVAEVPAVAPEAASPIVAETENRGFAGAAKVAAGIVAAPFLGLAWILVAPFVGLAALAWLGVKTVFVRAS
ncbi:response regulator [Ramlibacter alkalitolerans]|uniref:Response regulator n=1 Tax=Ramlibacter alkalitolerans TaxID=2039631 RepID=A0ABS1JU06_9BURK|nr:response regulator [Ramlibacter alkalitolerans]MBL0427616.1 response regulator [Ramlibacter alkalitolerans]